MAPHQKAAGVVQQVEESQSHLESAQIICACLKLPDLDTLFGLQDCFETFPKIWSQLKELWVKKNEKLMGGLCVIYGKMSKDSVLRTKLQEKGVLNNLTDALQHPGLRVVILRTLSIMTSHGGPNERITVADRAASMIITIAMTVPMDDPVFTYCVTVLCHTSYGVHSLDAPEKKAGKLRAVDARPLLNLMVRASKVPDRHVSDHAFGTVTMLTVHKAEDILANDAAQECIVGHLRHPELTTRIDALRSIYTLHRDAPHETVAVDPHRVMNGAKSLMVDEEYQKEARKFGSTTCLVAIFLQSTRDFQQAMLDNVRDKDMLKLGRRLYQLLMKSEWGIGDGMFGDEKGAHIDVGLPYVQWFESLPYCIKALRASEGANSEAATALELKYHIKHRRFRDAHKIARNYLEKVDSKCSYCYYALTMDCKDDKVGLGLAKKGLKTVKTSDKSYIRLGLLFNAVDYAGRLGIDMLDDHRALMENPTMHMKTAIAYLQSALVDAQTYIDVAPFDDRLLRAIISRYLVLFVAIKGPALVDQKLNVLAPYAAKLKSTERISAIVWSNVVQTNPRKSWLLIKKHYAKASAVWDPVFKEREARGEKKGWEAGKDVENAAPDGLEELVETMAMNHGHELETDENKWHRHALHPHLDEESLAMLTCTYCGNPSAQTRKCGRCGGVRYCDEKCQTEDWKAHKPHCKAGQVALAQKQESGA